MKKKKFTSVIELINEINSNKKVSKKCIKELINCLGSPNNFTSGFIKNYVIHNVQETTLQKRLKEHPELLEFFI